MYTESTLKGHGGGTITTTYFFGGAYEVRMEGSTTTTTKYYSLGGQTMLRDADGLKYLLTDHQGSVVAVLQRPVSLEWRLAAGGRKRATDSAGALLSQTRYLPYGEVRTDVGTITQTDLGYTGQKALDAQETTYKLGLMDYKARFYDPYLNRFTQPDTLVPGAPPLSLLPQHPHPRPVL